MLIAAASVAPVTAAPPAPGFPDADSETWVSALGGAAGPARDAAVARLHALLLRAGATRTAPRGTRVDVDDLATQAAVRVELREDRQERVVRGLGCEVIDVHARAAPAQLEPRRAQQQRVQARDGRVTRR